MPRMAAPGSLRPRVSRETRLLLTTVLLSVVALWVLARVRFPDRPTTASPVPPVLTQLAPPAHFDDLASTVSQVQADVLPRLVMLEVHRPQPSGGSVRRLVPALRFRNDAAAVLLGGSPEDQVDGAAVLAWDVTSGLGIVRVPDLPAPPLRVWAPQQVPTPRYMIVTDVSPAGISVHPVFVGSLHPIDSPIWMLTVWELPSRVGIPPGAFAYTTRGALAGLVVDLGERLAVVPAEVVIARAERLLSAQPRADGWLGVDVQALTPALRTATGASSGVVVTWVDPDGPAAEHVIATDIIEALDTLPIASPEQWRAHRRLTPGETIALRVRRNGGIEEVDLTVGSVPEPPPPQEPANLGLRMRWRSGAGAEVTDVETASAGARAGLRVGDLITRIGDIASPRPDQVSQMFLTSPSDGPVLAAITRGNERHVVVLVKP